MGSGELDSREYKVMLKPERFGSPDELEKGARKFWKELSARETPGNPDQMIGETLGLPSKSSWDHKEKNGRPVAFYDTPSGLLYPADYVIRRRGKGKDTKITVKKRSPDRVRAFNNHISTDEITDDWASRLPDDFEPKEKDKPFDGKFEEDVKPTDDGRQRSLFSRSVDLEGKGLKVVSLDSINAVDEIFPEFAKGVGPIKERKLKRVGVAKVREHVLEFEGTLWFLGGKDAGGSACLVAWYEKERPKRPCVVEFSYKHKGPEPRFREDVAVAAALLLQVLVGMKRWRPKRPLTKTRWIYDRADLVPKPNR